MKILIPPLYERKDIDVALEEYDIFGRGKLVENLTSLFRNTSDGLVITIDGEWGDGKTTLIKRWEKKLTEDEQFIPIYYNAFENDFIEDAFLSIAVNIHSALKKYLPKRKYLLEEVKKKTVRLTISFLKIAAKKTVTTLSHGMIDNEDIQTVSSSIEDSAAEIFETYRNLKKTIDDYQSYLKKILDNVNEEKDKKIVFFIDELDRCRPVFAIEIIEKIKHLFSIENVFFVLAINKRQLVYMIRNIYGMLEEDAEMYFQKFVHIETTIRPLVDPTEHPDDIDVKIRNFVDQLIELHEISDFFVDPSKAKSSIVDLLISIDVSLVTPRTIERILSLITIVLGSNKEYISDDHEMINTLCNMTVLKICKPTLYKKWRNGIFTIEELTSVEKQVYHQLELGLSLKHGTSIDASIMNQIKQVCQMLDIYAFYKVGTLTTEWRIIGSHQLGQNSPLENEDL